MPIEDHPNVPPTPGDEQIIWRFMTLEKLLSLLVTSSIYLTQVEKLRMDDPFESQFTQAHVNLFNLVQTNPSFAELFFREQTQGRGEAAADYLRNLTAIHTPATLQEAAERSARFCYANCWHINDHESAALWRLYSSNDAGVAIRTTIGRLKNALLTTDRILYLGEVQYIDFNKEIIALDNAINPIFRKRMSFAHERELRLATMEFNVTKQTAGISVPCGLEILIGELVVSPLAADWFVDTVRQVVGKFVSAPMVRKSSLFTGPSYSPSG
ncbi:DUF2971 domain-containing protein [Rhizobium sp. LEGMi12c]